MELREAIKVLDSDAHARDFDNDIRPYLPEPYRNQRASFIPSEHYDRNLGGTLGQSGAKVEERLAAMDTQQIDTAVMFPTSGLGVGRVRDPQFQTALCRAYNDFISDYCKASPRLKAVANLPVNNPPECAKELNRAVTKLGLCGGMLAAAMSPVARFSIVSFACTPRGILSPCCASSPRCSSAAFRNCSPS
jgi:predicted TIM-barrel fold metal-dependent hydrolase